MHTYMLTGPSHTSQVTSPAPPLTKSSASIRRTMTLFLQPSSPSHCWSPETGCTGVLQGCCLAFNAPFSYAPVPRTLMLHCFQRPHL